ncbi:MAG: tetratricopeptide repeat protein [Aggregatilineales bacterium]
MADFTPHVAPAREPSALPVMVPKKLVGREVTLARVYSLLKEAKPVLLYGPSGIGKSALGATLASAYTERAGGVLWLDVRDPSLTDLIVRVGRAYQIDAITSSDNPLAHINSAASALAQQSPLLVFDGVLNAQTIEEFLDRCARNLPVLLLNDEELDGAWPGLRLGRLEPDQSIALFKMAAEVNTADVSDQEIGELAEALNYTPLALVIAAGAVRATRQSPAEFLSALPDVPSAQVTPQLLALTASFRGLNSALQGLMLVLGATFTGSASAEMISLIGGAPEDSVKQALTMLLNRYLVERHQRYGEPHYRLHPVAHAFAQSWLRGSNRLEGLQAKVREAIFTYVRKHATSLPADHDRLSAEMDLIVATAAWAADRGDRDTATQLANTLMQAGDFINVRGYLHELLILRKLGASSTSAFPAYNGEVAPSPFPSTSDETDMSEPIAPLDEDDEDEALVELEEAAELDQDEELEDDVIPFDGAAFTSRILPEDDDTLRTSLFEELESDDLEAENGDDEREELHADFSDEEAFDELEDEDSDEDELDLIGLEPLETSVSTAAETAPLSLEPPATFEGGTIAELRRQLLAARSAHDRRRQAELYSAIAAEHENAGNDSEAIAAHTEALALYEAINDVPGMLSSSTALAELTMRTDNLQAAVHHATRGAKLAEERGSEISQMQLLTLLGDARQQLGESEAAIHAYSQALALARKANDERAEAVLLYKLGYAQLDDGSADIAIETWETALAMFRAQRRRDYEARVLGGLGTAYSDQGRWPEAINLHTSALHIAREVNDREEEIAQLTSLGYASVQANQLAQAVLRYRQALHVAYETNDKSSIVSITVDLVRLLVESPRHLAIAELLVDSALAVDSADRDLRRLKERIEDEREALGSSVELKPVLGTARDYAANAYTMLEA